MKLVCYQQKFIIRVISVSYGLLLIPSPASPHRMCSPCQRRATPSPRARAVHHPGPGLEKYKEHVTQIKP